MAQSDEGRTALREAIWIDKFDHSTDPPTFAGRVEIVNGQIVREIGADDDEARRDAEAGREASTASTGETGLPKDDGEEVSAKEKLRELESRPNPDQLGKLPGIDPPRMMAIVAKSATECGIDFERALRFVLSVATEMKAARSNAAQAPADGRPV